MGIKFWQKGDLAYLDSPVYGLIKVAVVGLAQWDGLVAVRITQRKCPQIHEDDDNVRTGRVVAALARNVVPRSAVYVSGGKVLVRLFAWDTFQLPRTGRSYGPLVPVGGKVLVP